MSELNMKVVIDRVNADSDLTDLERKNQKIRRETERNRMSLLQVWSMGNQIATMMLSQASAIAKSQKVSAISQGILTGLQLAQQEVAVAQMIIQASAAFAAGSLGQAYAFLSLAGLMQVNILRTIAIKRQTYIAARTAANIASQIEAYRSG